MHVCFYLISMHVHLNGRTFLTNAKFSSSSRCAHCIRLAVTVAELPITLAFGSRVTGGPLLPPAAVHTLRHPAMQPIAVYDPA